MYSGIDGGAEAAAPGSSWTNGSCLEGSSSGGICTSSHWHYAKLWQGPDNVAIYKQYWDQYSGSLEALSKENPLMHHLLQVNVVNDKKHRSETFSSFSISETTGGTWCLSKRNHQKSDPCQLFQGILQFNSKTIVWLQGFAKVFTYPVKTKIISIWITFFEPPAFN